MFKILRIAGCGLLISCTTPDPILPGERIPVFSRDEIKVLNKQPTNLGAEIKPEKCDFKIDGGNQIWQGKTRVFAGLPTESEFSVEKKLTCRGKYIYAGLSTGELVKIDSESRNLEWTADVFELNTPTHNGHFLDIIAMPVYNGGYVYAGGLGNAFCKIKDSDGTKVWCLPIGVREIVKSTKNFNFVKSTDGNTYIVSANGEVYDKLLGTAE